MREFELIHSCFDGKGGRPKAETILAIGDDASIHQISADDELVVSTDSSVQGIHWPDDFPLSDAADRAICAALSDLAAMGAHPLCAWLNVMSDGPEAVKAMSRGMTRALSRYDVQLVGGDTCRSRNNALSVTVAGTLPKGTSMRRDHAQEGDDVWLIGLPGLSSLGLNQWFLGDHDGRWVPCFRDIKPFIDQGIALRESGVRCCMDVSDGLLQDACHICSASGVGMELDISRLPHWFALVEEVGSQAALKAVCAGGEDYALLFTVPKHININIEEAVCIGQCIRGSKVQLMLDGHPVAEENITNQGFDHFV